MMKDSRFYKLSPYNGNLVLGFGSAYKISSDRKIISLNDKGHSSSHEEGLKKTCKSLNYSLVILSFTFINAQEHKLVTVGGSITETAIALGHQKDIIGIDLSSIYPKEIVKNIPKIGYWLQLPKEGILSLKT